MEGLTRRGVFEEVSFTVRQGEILAFAGLVPCELCLEQRLAYYWGLPVLAAILVLWNRLPLPVWYIAMAIAALLSPNSRQGSATRWRGKAGALSPHGLRTCLPTRLGATSRFAAAEPPSWRGSPADPTEPAREREGGRARARARRGQDHGVAE